MRISKRIEWCMGHRHANHPGDCRNLHGHQYVLEATIEGTITQDANSPRRGMVVDFGDLHALLKTRVHDVCDHAFMIAEDDAVMMDFFTSHPDLKHVVIPFDPTAENIANWIFANLKDPISGLGVRLHSVQLWETPFNSVTVEES